MEQIPKELIITYDEIHVCACKHIHASNACVCTVTNKPCTLSFCTVLPLLLLPVAVVVVVGPTLPFLGDTRACLLKDCVVDQ